MILIRSLFVMISVCVLAGGSPTVAAQSCSPLEDAYARAIYFEQIGDDETALAIAICLVEENPNNGSLLNLRGVIYEKLGQLELAREDYEAAVALDDMGCPCALSNLGELYETIGDYETATEYFEQALAQAVEYREFYYGNLARVARKQGDLDAALSHFDAALVEMPDSPLIFLLRGQYWLALDEPMNAAADMARYIEGIRSTTETYSLRLNALRNTRWRTSHVQRGIFDGQAGDLFTAYADPRDPADTINPLLVLLSPDGTPLTANDDIDDTSNAAMLSYRLPTTGTYTLLITHGFQTTPVRGSLRLLSLLEATQREIDLGEMRVTAGDVPLNVREQPTLEGDILFTIREGERVTLIDGPSFADGYRWWFLATDSGGRGWALDTVETVRQFSPIAPN